MDLYSLPKEMQDKVLKLAAEHPITVEEAKHYYLMGGEHADYLCCLRTAGCSEEYIKLHNQLLWDKKNKKIWEEIMSQ
jgi:hypothetical protein